MFLLKDIICLIWTDFDQLHLHILFHFTVNQYYKQGPNILTLNNFLPSI